ncbi:hypothetical protein [Sphingomonas sp.]|uniref:hypothetical protein n=1 Tax=Sphingomonas sp. TaxID=28214 RepID=UPI001D47F203|nr:hypothetical protein [Sphingomonas sp.]MBX9796871.1 hypothetical protein [Sphingomonas sp.]
MIASALRESLAPFDDAALATLANAGLVRRAHRDAEEGKVRLVAAEGVAVELEVDGQRVLLDDRGPRAADCTCSSAAMCRHRLAAVIFVRADTPGADDAPTEADAPGDASAIVMALDLQQLEKWAGKAGWRAAMELAPTATAVEVSPKALSVSFVDVDGPVRILQGLGFDGIVSKASKARLKAYHAAAVLAARQHFGEALPEAASGNDAEPAQHIAPDPAFLSLVAAALVEVAANGLNLAPLPLEESLFELSVSSRADNLPRLAALLRAIAAQIRLRRARALDFDPDRLLELSATCLALVRSLGGPDARRRTMLAGNVRRSFERAEPLRLVGCGGERWTSASGARGLTGWFVDPDRGRWLSVNIARGPGLDPSFVPRDAWASLPLWQSEPLAVLAHARLDLSGVGQSADNRLSVGRDARAIVVERNVRPDPSWSCIVRDWSTLRDMWMRQVGLGLDAVEQPAVCLIEPSQIAAPFFDELAQQLVWPVCDTSGRWLALTAELEEPVSVTIEALDAHAGSGWRGMVLVRMERRGERLALCPITLFGGGDPVDLTLWQPPRGVSGRKGAQLRDWLWHLRQRQSRGFVTVGRSGTDATLAKAWRHLVDRAEMGPPLARTIDGDRAAIAAQIEKLGLARLGDMVRNAEHGEALLAAAYGLMAARQKRCAPPLLQ